MANKNNFSRRAFLYGAGGVTVALPFLDALRPRKVTAAAPERPRYCVFVRQANGCAQQEGEDPEQFWPRERGPVSKESLSTIDADRAVSELAEYGDKLLMVSGTRFPYPSNGCAHSGGGNQVLTAQKVSIDPSGNKSLAMGESVDNRIARMLNSPSNPEPLTLYSGAAGGYINEVLSYSGEKQLRGAKYNPWDAYESIFKLAQLPEQQLKEIKARRTSVNDLLKEQMSALMSSPKLSSEDQDRLQLHFEAIRDIEIELACKLPPQEELDAMKAQTVYSNDRMQTIVMMHMNLIALAFACDYTRAATLQIGDGNDGTEYMINGVKFPRYHQISHRLFSDGGPGDPIPDAVAKHHVIDREHGKMFAHLLKRMSMYTTDTGTLLDDSVAVWCNDLGTGPGHSFKNIPWVCAGSAGGFLKTGHYIDAGDVTHNKFHNTILSAMGLTNSEGGHVDDFGDPELEPGVIDAMIAV